MIIDSLDNMSLYYNNDIWLNAMNYLNALAADTRDGEYPIDGDALFARIMTYDTKPVNDCVPEAHQKYIDVQMVLAGEEYAFWYPLTGLKLHTPYDPQTDVAFYEPQPKAGSQSILKRGIIAVFFPEDAHMPSVSIQATPSIVKKVVIKIAIESMGK